MKQFRNMLLPLVLALALAFVGCASPPDAEKAAAKTAMDAAIAASAGKYAVADFNAAMKIWNGAEVQMNEQKYEEAKQSYVNAKAAFAKAAAAAAEGKKAALSEATAALAGVEEAWKNLETAAKAVEKRMKDQKEAWEADGKAYADGLKVARDSLNSDPVIAKKLAADLKAAIIDKWDAVFKELAAAPPPKKGKAGKK
jgi:hypothetical protein